jgi:hypothetical protein
MKKRHIVYGLTISLAIFAGIPLFQYLNPPAFYETDVYGYGFPFAIYEYVQTLNRGRPLLLGIIGNVLFTIVFGYFIGFIISFITKNTRNLE